MRNFKVFFLSASLCFLVQGCATYPKFPLSKAEAFRFQDKTKAPVIGVLQPVVQVSANYGITDRERLDPHIKRAENELLKDFVSSLQRKGYAAFAKPVDYEGLPKSEQDRRLRWVFADANAEFDLMGRAVYRNASTDKDKPLDYRLGRLSTEVSDFMEQKPDWLMFTQTAAFVYGILPLSEVEDTTASQKLGALLGVGIVSPGYDYIVHIVGIVDARNGQLLWFNTEGQSSKSFVFPRDRANSVEAALKKLPAYGTDKPGKL